MEKLGRGAALFATGLSLAAGCGSESTHVNGPENTSSTVAGTTGAPTTATTDAGSTTSGGASVTQGSSGNTTSTTGNPMGTTSTSGGDTATTTGAQGPLGSTGTTGGTSGTSATTGTSGDATTGTSTTGGGGGGIDGYNDDFVEFVGEDCELPEAMALSPASHALPDPFKKADGTRMTSISEWACQRAWLKKQVEGFVHGAKPGTPDMVTGSVSDEEVQVQIQHGGASASYSVSIELPPGASGPVPGMFRADGSGVPTSFLHAEGVAAMSYSHSSAESAYNAIYGGSGVSIQIKWAWAVSRIIDVLVSERDAGSNDIIDPTALGTTGCSYAGKSAFTVGAFDERIALGIPVESGTGGLGSYRVVGDNDLGPNGGENPEQVSEACGQNWLVSQVCSGNVDAVPADAHFLVAMYAPRGFTTLDNNRIGHLGPVAQFTSAAAGAEVFKALGIESHVGYHGGNDGDPHMHCSFNQSQQETARTAIQGFLTKTIPPANFMEPKLRNQSDQPVAYDLANYIDWETPTLE
ncbi:MAG TPA: hypothetical protein VI197_29405 [Polyangiaceae bacterium]